MESFEVARPVLAEPTDRSPPGIRALSWVGQAYMVLAYGPIGFGIILFGAPGLLIAALSAPASGIALDALVLAGAGGLIVLALLVAVFGVRRRIVRGDLLGAQLPALLVLFGNLIGAVIGGALGFDLLWGLGAIGAVLYVAIFAALRAELATPA